MTETTEPPPVKERSWPATIAKIVFFAAVFFAVIFTVMANMGGSNDTLKGAVEDFLSGISGYHVQIDTLNRMDFFPSIRVDVTGIEMSVSEAESDPVIAIDRIHAVTSFWDVTLGTSKIRTFDVEELHALPGSIASQALYLEHVGIIEGEEESKAFLEATGTLGPHRILFLVDLEPDGEGKKRRYKLGDSKPFTLSVGDFKAEGNLQSRKNGLHLEDLKLGAPDDVVTGKLHFSTKGERKLRITGNINIGRASTLKLNLTMDSTASPKKIAGRIETEALYMNDLNAFLAFHEKIETILGLHSQEGEEAKHELNVELMVQEDCLLLTNANLQAIMSELPATQSFPSVDQRKKYSCDGPSP